MKTLQFIFRQLIGIWMVSTFEYREQCCYEHYFYPSWYSYAHNFVDEVYNIMEPEVSIASVVVYSDPFQN